MRTRYSLSQTRLINISLIASIDCSSQQLIEKSAQPGVSGDLSNFGRFESFLCTAGTTTTMQHNRTADVVSLSTFCIVSHRVDAIDEDLVEHAL